MYLLGQPVSDLDEPVLFEQVHRLGQTRSLQASAPDLDEPAHQHHVLVSAAAWESVELLTATSGTQTGAVRRIDSIARRVWGVPVVLNQGFGDSVGLVIVQDAVTATTTARWRSSGPTPSAPTSRRTRSGAGLRADSASA